MSHWKDDADRIREAALYKNIKILVWGPGNPGPKGSPQKIRAYKKRLQIRDVLRKKMPVAEVHFTEDPEMQALAADIPGQLEKEALQAYSADVIIMLDISRGADLELDYFVPNFAWFRDKVFVLLPEKYVPPHGLVKEVFDYLRKTQVVGFSAAEFARCDVAKVKAVKLAQAAALSLMLKGRVGALL